MGPPLQRQLHFDQSGSLAAAWRSFWAQAIFSCPAGPATIEIDECITFWDTQLPSRILTSRSTLRYPYHKSDPSENRFGAVWLKVCATLLRETHFAKSGAVAAAGDPKFERVAHQGRRDNKRARSGGPFVVPRFSMQIVYFSACRS